MLTLTRSLTFCCLIATATLTMADENGLFSDVRTGSVFGGQVTASGQDVTANRRITSAEELRDLLNSAGLDAKVAGTGLVTLTKKLDPWEFPVFARISEDEQTVAIVLGLRTITDTSQLTSDLLWQMMSVSQQNAPYVFTYNSNRERTELYLVTGNKGLTGQGLRDEITRMAVLARNQSKLWAAPDSSENDEKPEEATAKAAPPESQTTQERLVGTWSAERSDSEAFAIEFSSDQTFKLVYVKGGSQTKSTGQYDLGNGTLTLKGSDGLTLSGQFSQTSDTQFRFTMAQAAALVFTKAK